MREIKFRAWHKLINKIVQVDAIDFSGGTIRKGDPCVVEDKTNGGCYLLDNLLLMQYTGLEDKNGVEIYEGDIVEYFDWCYCCGHDNKDKEFEWEFENAYGDWQTHTYQPMIGEVSWNEDYQTYNPIVFSMDDYNGNCFANVCLDRGDFYNKLNSKGKTNYPTPYYEVIGNIFKGVDK